MTKYAFIMIFKDKFVEPSPMLVLEADSNTDIPDELFTIEDAHLMQDLFLKQYNPKITDQKTRMSLYRTYSCENMVKLNKLKIRLNFKSELRLVIYEEFIDVRECYKFLKKIGSMHLDCDITEENLRKAAIEFKKSIKVLSDELKKNTNRLRYILPAYTSYYEEDLTHRIICNSSTVVGLLAGVKLKNMKPLPDKTLKEYIEAIYNLMQINNIQGDDVKISDTRRKRSKMAAC